MSEHVTETGTSAEEFDWGNNFELARHHLQRVDLTATNKSYAFGDDRRAEIIPVAQPDGGLVHVIRERFGAPESADRRRDNYYFLGKVVSGEGGDILLVLQDHNLDHEMDMVQNGEFGRVKERQYRQAARLTEGVTDELIYPEVTLGQPHEMHRYILALNGIAAAQRAELAAQHPPEA
jgi:hypothetical protein